MNAYVVVGFSVAFGGTAAYAVWTVLQSRKIAARVLALQQLDAQLQEARRGDD